MSREIKSLLDWKRTSKGYPCSIEIHPTNMCNLNCIMCGTRLAYRNKKKSNPNYDLNEDVQFEVSKERWIELIKEAYRLGVFKWLITGGGEPMLRKDIVISLVKEIKSKGMYGNINTNGVLFTEEDVRVFVENGWDMIMFSFDSAKEKIHDMIRGVKGTYKKALNTMVMFREIKDELGVKKPKITFNTLLCNQNYNDLRSLIDLASDLKGTDITFIPLIKFGNFRKDLSLNETHQKELQEDIPSLIDYSKKKKINTNLHTFEKNTFETTSKMDKVILSKTHKKEDDPFLSVPCYEPFLNLVIRMDGKISPCCMLENHDENIKNKKLKDIWFGSYFSNLRKTLLEGNLPSGCKTCVHSQFVHNQHLKNNLREYLS